VWGGWSTSFTFFYRGNRKGFYIKTKVFTIKRDRYLHDEEGEKKKATRVENNYTYKKKAHKLSAH
jgi:hypothetical protein